MECQFASYVLCSRKWNYAINHGRQLAVEDQRYHGQETNVRPHVGNQYVVADFTRPTAAAAFPEKRTCPLVHLEPAHLMT